MKNQFLLILILTAIVMGCSRVYDLPPLVENYSRKDIIIEPFPQSMEGNPDSGFYYLTNGGYLGTGLPYDMLKKRVEKNPARFANVAGLPSKYGFAVFETELGVKVMNGTCFSCHAGAIDGKVMLGLGNSLNNNQMNLTFPSKLMDRRVRNKYRKDMATIESYDEFGKNFRGMAPYTYTNNPGVSSAARIAEACMQFRNPIDLTMTEEAQYNIRKYNVASDIPALWHLQKKNALYYTAVGRGDFTKLLFQASVLGIQDSTAARKAQEKFVHIAAWIRSLEVPKYPQATNAQLASKGKQLFKKKCQNCHGTYDAPETYPNKLIPINRIGTDPLYASYATDSEIVEWYNKSWFATSEPKSWFEPGKGYVAPPLDGIWATAPYLHNGAVPTLYEMLNSKARPKYWQRTKDSKDFDWKKVGWQYESKKKGKGRMTYDTSLPGYGNEGHTFGDQFTEEERWAVVEYLKTL